MLRLHLTAICGIIFLVGAQPVTASPQKSSDANRVVTLEKKVEDLRPGLGEIMAVLQHHHAKLGLAGKAENWELAAYEIDEVLEGLEVSAKFHPTAKGSKVPLSEFISTNTKQELEALGRAIKAKNGPEFHKSFLALTKSCNSCHQTTGFGFVVIQEPSSTDFSNQKFSR